MSNSPRDDIPSPEEIRAANLYTRRQVLRHVALGAGVVLLPGMLGACVDDYMNPLLPGTPGERAQGDEVGAFSEPFLSEIKVVSFNFPPKGWALCNGQFLPINQNQALFALLGTTYGGNGQTTFALPNLRGRVPIHMDASHSLGEAAGSTSVTVNIQQLPTHLHGLQASGSDTNPTLDPTGAFFAPVNNTYTNPASGGFTTLHPGMVSSVGGSQPHNNMMPYLTLNFIIALQGIFPSRN
jgi:microcystin-dependent protein